MLAVTTTPYTVRPIPLTAPRGSGSSHIQAQQQQQPHTLTGLSHVSFFSRRPELTRQPSWHLIYGEINITHNWVQFGSVRLSSTRLTFSLALSSLLLLLLCIHKFRLGCRFRNGFQTLFQFHFGLLRYGFIVLIVSGVCVDHFDVPATYFIMFYVRYKNMN